MRHVRRSKSAFTAVAVAAVVAGGFLGMRGAFAADPGDGPTETNGGSIVEHYTYPGAAEILAEQNVRLLSGDGHIVLVDCATPPVNGVGPLVVWTTDETIGPTGLGQVCFTITASSGWLNLEVPGVYEIRGDGRAPGAGHEVTAELETDEGDEVTVEVDPNESEPVGIGTAPDAPPTMLLRLTVTG